MRKDFRREGNSIDRTLPVTRFLYVILHGNSFRDKELGSFSILEDARSVLQSASIIVFRAVAGFTKNTR